MCQSLGRVSLRNLRTQIEIELEQAGKESNHRSLERWVKKIVWPKNHSTRKERTTFNDFVLSFLAGNLRLLVMHPSHVSTMMSEESWTKRVLRPARCR